MLPTTGITTTLVGNTLSVSTRNVTQLCTNANINKLSRNKPVRYVTNIGITDELRKSANYGITAHKVDTTNITGSHAWTYNPPATGWPKRLGDFRGYEHTSTSPMAAIFPTELSIDKTSNNYVILDIDDDLTLPDGNIKVKDVHAYELNYYPGVLVYNTSRNLAIFKTAGVTLLYWSSSTISIPLLPAWKAGDTVEMYTILSPTDYTGAPENTPAISSNMYYILPTEGQGYGVAKIIYTNIAMDLEIVGTPTLRVVETYYQDEPVWSITTFTASYKNSGTTTVHANISVSIEDLDYDAGISDLSEISINLTPNQQVDNKSNDGNIFINRTYGRYIEVTVRSVDFNTGIGGAIWYRYYDLVDKTWKTEY